MKPEFSQEIPNSATAPQREFIHDYQQRAEKNSGWGCMNPVDFPMTESVHIAPAPGSTNFVIVAVQCARPSQGDATYNPHAWFILDKNGRPVFEKHTNTNETMEITDFAKPIPNFNIFRFWSKNNWNWPPTDTKTWQLSLRDNGDVIPYELDKFFENGWYTTRHGDTVNLRNRKDEIKKSASTLGKFHSLGATDIGDIIVHKTKSQNEYLVCVDDEIKHSFKMTSRYRVYYHGLMTPLSPNHILMRYTNKEASKRQSKFINTGINLRAISTNVSDMFPTLKYLVVNIATGQTLISNLDKFGIHPASHFISAYRGTECYSLPLEQFLGGDMTGSRAVVKPDDYKYPEYPHSLITLERQKIR